MGFARPRALIRRSAEIATKSVIIAEVLVGAEVRETVPSTAAVLAACGVQTALVAGGSGQCSFAPQRAGPNLRLTADLCFYV